MGKLLNAVTFTTLCLQTFGITLVHAEDDNRLTLYDRNKRQLNYERGQRHHYCGCEDQQYRRVFYRNCEQDYSNCAQNNCAENNCEQNGTCQEMPPFPEDPDWEIYPPPE